MILSRSPKLIYERIRNTAEMYKYKRTIEKGEALIGDKCSDSERIKQSVSNGIS